MDQDDIAGVGGQLADPRAVQTSSRMAAAATRSNAPPTLTKPRSRSSAISLALSTVAPPRHGADRFLLAKGGDVGVRKADPVPEDVIGVLAERGGRRTGRDATAV